MNAIDRAHKAKAILDSPVYQEAYAMVRMAIIDRIERCPIADTQTAEDLRKCLKLLRDVRANFEAALGDGKVEQFNLTEAEKRKANPLRHLFR